jgi:hypothetical protein
VLCALLLRWLAAGAALGAAASKCSVAHAVAARVTPPLRRTSGGARVRILSTFHASRFSHATWMLTALASCLRR